MSRILKPRPRAGKQPAARRLRLGAAEGVFATARAASTSAASAGLASAGVVDAIVHAAGAAWRPALAMPAPEDRRQILITSALSALLHLLVIGAIAYLGVLARRAVEEVIPVTIFNQSVELPGSNEPAPLPAPKLLAAPMARALPLAPQPTNLAAVPAPRVVAPSLDLTTPRSIDLADLASASLAAQSDVSPVPSAADIATIEPLEISAADLVAPVVDLSGPSKTASRTPTDLKAPSAFESLAEVNTNLYRGAVSALPTALAGSEAAGPLVATGVSAEYLAAGYAGGDPNAVGTVPCLQSAFVVRYQRLIEVRTRSRWELPLEAGPNDFVKIRIAIDHTGTIVKLEQVDATDPLFSESAIEALRSASPFPPLDDNTRCLTAKSFILTFNYPDRP